jgi:hypothetical protein
MVFYSNIDKVGFLHLAGKPEAFKSLGDLSQSSDHEHLEVHCASCCTTLRMTQKTARGVFDRAQQHAVTTLDIRKLTGAHW